MQVVCGEAGNWTGVFQVLMGLYVGTYVVRCWKRMDLFYFDVYKQLHQSSYPSYPNVNKSYNQTINKELFSPLHVWISKPYPSLMQLYQASHTPFSEVWKRRSSHIFRKSDAGSVRQRVRKLNSVLVLISSTEMIMKLSWRTLSLILHDPGSFQILGWICRAVNYKNCFLTCKLGDHWSTINLEAYDVIHSYSPQWNYMFTALRLYHYTTNMPTKITFFSTVRTMSLIPKKLKTDSMTASLKL